MEPLVIIRDDGVPRPYLLESWQASDDLKTWTLNLEILMPGPRKICWSWWKIWTAWKACPMAVRLR